MHSCVAVLCSSCEVSTWRPESYRASRTGEVRARRETIVVVELAAQPLASQDWSTIANHGFDGHDQPVADSLVIALAVLMQNELVNPFAQRGLTEENHTLQAGLLDPAHESLRVRVQIR